MVLDVFHAFLVEKADFEGVEEIPCIKTSRLLPGGVIPFSKALHATDYDKWVVFYEHDDRFVRLWNKPRKYINILKKYRGVITPQAIPGLFQFVPEYAACHAEVGNLSG